MRIRLDDGVTIDTNNLKFMGADVDRHANVLLFVRRRGKMVFIRNRSNLDAFMAEFRKSLVEPSAMTGSFRWLCERYYRSAKFTLLEDSTRRQRRRMLDAFCERHGTKPFSLMEQKNVRQFRDEKLAEGSPVAANKLLQTLRAMFTWAVEVDEAQYNPAKGVSKIVTDSSGLYTWTVEEVFQFMNYHPVGTNAHKALVLMLLAGVRPSDAIRLGPQHERPGDNEAPYGRLDFTEYRYRKRNPKHRVIPILQELRKVLDTTPSGHQTYLVTKSGKPFSNTDYFDSWFKRQCQMAGLPKCTPNGLGKAGAIISAQNDIPADTLMAIYGRTKLKQAEI